MSDRTYDTTYAVETANRTVAASPAHGYAGEQAFIWVAWAAAFGFWAFTMSSFFGILKAIF